VGTFTTSLALARAAAEAFEWARRQPDVREVEVFVAANALLLARLNYTSHIACNGVEEPKSSASCGIGIQAVFATPDGPVIGFGSEPSDLTVRGAERAFAKARRAAVHDPEFVSLPEPVPERRALGDYHDPALMALDDRALVEAGWTVVNGALRTFMTSGRLAELAGGEAGLRDLGLIVGGDVTVVQERVAIVSTHLPEVQTDESTSITASVTAMVEARDAKGAGWSTATRLDDFTDEAGVEAAQNAIAAIDGVRVPSGAYAVVLGRQPLADLLNNIIVPGCMAQNFYASNTPFLGKLGQRVASPLLTLYDHGAAPGLVVSKGITCEGLPTGRTDLIRGGVLVGCLSSWYETQRLMRDPARAEKLGRGPDDALVRALAPRNGFRFTAGGGRQFDTSPSVSASNVVLEGEDPISREELFRRVGNGLYIGRIWYTYPVNGLHAGDFTCTVVGDSYIIRDGRIAEPLRANAIRINDNIATILNNVVGVTKDVRGTVVWAEVAYTPELAVSTIRVDAIAAFMEDLA
jgi:PmbA protein